jgi:hypothetical protein
MISDQCDFNEFVMEAKGKGYQEIIFLADREATEAERRFYQPGATDQDKARCGQNYAQCLKGFITFMRYGIKPANIHQETLLLFDHIRDEVQPELRPPRIQH